MSKKLQKFYATVKMSLQKNWWKITKNTSANEHGTTHAHWPVTWDTESPSLVSITLVGRNEYMATFRSEQNSARYKTEFCLGIRVKTTTTAYQMTFGLALMAEVAVSQRLTPNGRLQRDWFLKSPIHLTRMAFNVQY